MKILLDLITHGGTLAEQLLSNLLADKDHPNDVALAHDLIKEISKE